MAPSAWANFKQAVQIALRQFGIAAKLLSKVYETLLAPETCEQEEVGEFKGVTFKIANHKPLWQNWAEPTTRYASRPCTPRSTCVPQSVARTSRYRLPWYYCHQYCAVKAQDVPSEFSHRRLWSIRSYQAPPRPSAAPCQDQ